MKKILSVCIFLILLILLLPYSYVFTQTSLEKHESLATKLVNQCANIKENDFVLISGSVRDADLMDEIAIQTSKIGAHNFVTLVSQKRNRRYFDVVPEKYDSRSPELWMKMAQLIDVVISIESGESTDLFRDVPATRLQAFSEASNSFLETLENRNVRSVNLGNDLYPTEALAKRFGISQSKLADLFWNGVNVDYLALQKKGESLKQALASGKKIQLTSKAGTDITVEITARPVYLSDGIITDEEAKSGYPECQVWLPAGEVFVTPVPGSAEGIIYLEHYYYQGEEIKQLKLEFQAGKLISMTAEAGIENYKNRYDLAGEGKDEFSFIDIGVNPEVKFITGSKMEAWMASGMVSVGTGNNKWAGGENNSSYGSAYHLADATIKIDGKIIVEKGVLK